MDQQQQMIGTASKPNSSPDQFLSAHYSCLPHSHFGAGRITKQQRRAAGLASPEIAALIVDMIDQDIHARHSLDPNLLGFIDFIQDNPAPIFEIKRRALGPLACLSHMWFGLAVPRLWRQTCITRSDPSLTTLFQRIAPTRRNMYAQYIEVCGIETVPVETPGQNEGECPAFMLSNVDFPCLKGLVIRHSGRSGRKFFPRLGRNRVEAILLHSASYKTTSGDRPIVVVADMEKILLIIPELFPNLRRLTPSTLYLGEMNPIYLRWLESWERRKLQSDPDNITPFKVFFDRALPEAKKPDTLHGCFMSLAGQDRAFALAS
ncbi:hypothetical protein PG997_002593 [Apiospora hydei]|uniref:Uncharacterized protein n=1 Tax=Apiospora hydei TaxID=1337664 RepID=A0ABR1WX13_9PEZI